MHTARTIVLAVFLIAGWQTAICEELEVFQDLDEVTSRIPNLADKPYMKLIEASGGYLQNEVIIFRDIETGNEIWSLTRELCRDMAHTGRRPAWSGNGQYISFKGNMVFYHHNDRKLRKRTWAGYSYVANADGSEKRPMFATLDGKLAQLNCNKYNMWDAAKPNAWYCIVKGKLIRVLIKDGVKDSLAEAIYTFPNTEGKIIQEISDANFMLIEEGGDKPNCYVVNLNKDPSEDGFCLSYPLKGEIHSGSFRLKRSRRILTGGYENLPGGICLSFDGDKLEPATFDVHITEGRRMGHLWYGPPDDRVGFFGKYKGKGGLWVQLPGQAPQLLADVPDGHATWCGRDPEWFFGAIGPGRTKDEQYARRLVAGNADGKTVKIVCTPFDRRRPEDGGYGALPLPTQSRDGNKCWFHSSMLMPTDKQTGSYIAVFRRPYAPVELKLADKPGPATLQWTPHAINYEVKGYHVYRSDDGGKTFAELTDEAIAGTEFADTTAQLGETYLYAVTAEEWSRLESDVTSFKITVHVKEPKALVVASGDEETGWDRTLPATPANFKATVADGLIRLAWEPARDKDFRYCNIYASSEGKPEVGQKRLLVSPTHDQTHYIDWTAPKGKTIHYAITAIDRQANESAPAYASASAPEG